MLHYLGVDVVGGVTLGASVERFCDSWDFDVATEAIAVTVTDEAASVVVVIVIVILEV